MSFEPSVDELELPDGWSWGDAPQVHGSWEIGIPTKVYPGRRVLNMPGNFWRSSPEECPDDSGKGIWLLDGHLMVCPTCGLDCT